MLYTFVGKILLKMQELIERGAIKPLPRIVFKTDEVEKAFRYMGIGEHIGKVLIKIREEDLGKESIPRKLFKGVPRCAISFESILEP